MPTRTAEATWKGDLKSGEGFLKTQTGACEGRYSFTSRFQEGSGTNPEELIAAAHAGCYSMALAFGLEQAGYKPERVTTSARVHIEKVGGGFKITAIDLKTRVSVRGIERDNFQEIAADVKAKCPVSAALAGTEIRLEAELER